jgi:ribonuclease T2
MPTIVTEYSLLTFLTRLAASGFAAMLALAAVPPAHAGMSDRPGDFDYYALVLSWSPSFCLSGSGSHEGDPQCSANRPYAFVLHGLWPQYDVHWPEDCNVGNDPTTVPDDLARSMLDIMPSDKLVQHEYGKHGTCSGLDMGAYLLMARRLFTSINVPPQYKNLSAPLQEPLSQLRDDLLSANKQFGPGMIAVDCDKNGRLVEIHFCYSKAGEPQNCGRNEIQAKMCRQDAISMPPVRGAVANGASPDPQQGTADANAANDNTDAVPTYHRKRHHHRSTTYNN